MKTICMEPEKNKKIKNKKIKKKQSEDNKTKYVRNIFRLKNKK